MLKIESFLKDEDFPAYAGMESIIEPQLNDPFISEFKVLLQKLGDEVSLFIKDSIPRYDKLDEDGKNVVYKYQLLIEELTKKRFGFPVNMNFNDISSGMHYTILFPGKDHVFKGVDNKINEPTNAIVSNIVKNISKANIIIDKTNAKVLGADWYRAYIYHSFIDFIDFYKRQALDTFIAIFMHELGHNFTILEYSNRITRYSITLMESISLLKNNDSKRAEKKLSEYIDTKETFNSHNLLKEVNKKNKTLLTINGSFNITRECERLADEFVTKFGLGDQIALYFSKFTKKNDINHYGSELVKITIISIILELLRSLTKRFGLGIITDIIGSLLIDFRVLPAIIQGTLLFLLGFYFILLYVVISNIGDESYDPNEFRVGLIKRNYIKMLQSYNINPNDAKELISQIELIDAYVFDIKKELETDSFFYKLFQIFKRGGKELLNMTDLDHKLMSLINNDILTSSKKLELYIDNN